MTNIKWLAENGGPAIKLGMMHEGMVDRNKYDAGGLVNELLQIEKVGTALTYFDGYKEYRTVPLRKLANDIHDCYENCYERFMPFLIGLGFRAGISALDEKIDIMRQVYRYIISSDGGGGEIIVTYMLKAGYYDEDMLFYLNLMLDKLYNTAKQQCFDIYETDPSKIRWAKLPKNWKNGPIAKDIHVHDVVASPLPLPTIYHINYMANIYKHISDSTVREKIDTVIKYVMHPEYQKFKGIYGASWFYGRAYYAPSPGISLPLYTDNRIEGYKDTLEMMSNFPAATDTGWFCSCIKLLEQYRTERGTYIFPDECLYSIFAKPANPGVIYDTYISKEALSGIKRNLRRAFVNELCSTYYMELLKGRVGRK